MENAVVVAPKERLCLSLREAADLIGLSEWTVGEMARRGEIPSFKMGRRRMISRFALEQYLQQRAS